MSLAEKQINHFGSIKCILLLSSESYWLINEHQRKHLAQLLRANLNIILIELKLL